MKSPDGERKKATLALMVIDAPVEDVESLLICACPRTTTAHASALEEALKRGILLFHFSKEQAHGHFFRQLESVGVPGEPGRLLLALPYEGQNYERLVRRLPEGRANWPPILDLSICFYHSRLRLNTNQLKAVNLMLFTFP